jgi:hypothetical protein
MEPKKEGQSEFFSWQKELIKKTKFLLVFSIKKKPKSTLLSLSLSFSLSRDTTTREREIARSAPHLFPTFPKN